MGFTTGFDVLEDDLKPRTSFVRNYDYLKLEDGETGIFRFVTEGDEVISVRTHQSIPTKDKPEGYNGKWPISLPGACRYDSAFDGIHSDCYVCDFKVENPRTGKPISAGRRYWALAVQQEEIREKGVVKGYRDMLVERPEIVDGKETGRQVKMLKVIVINQGAKNFFQALHGIYGMTGTITDRPYAIKRSGSSIDTTYTIFPMPETRDESGRPYGKNSTPEWWDEHYTIPIQKMGVDLGEIVMEQASDDRYNRFFDPRVSNDRSAPKPAADDDRLEAGEQPDVFSGTVDPDNLEDMVNRVRGWKK